MSVEGVGKEVGKDEEYDERKIKETEKRILKGEKNEKEKNNTNEESDVEL